jgi:hypothetical protein
VSGLAYVAKLVNAPSVARAITTYGSPKIVAAVMTASAVSSKRSGARPPKPDMLATIIGWLSSGVFSIIVSEISTLWTSNLTAQSNEQRAEILERSSRPCAMCR